jgi:hypothetical protein
MPLILAIEPDRRQAARVNALARDPLNVEMFITESAERALAAIAKRVPDLILTSRLLSPKDEMLLDERLRELDAAGTKVQTLMIPMLASSKDSGKKAGLLNRLRRSADQATGDGGCDPAVFAEQIAEYLERSAGERVHDPATDEDEGSVNSVELTAEAPATAAAPADTTRPNEPAAGNGPEPLVQPSAEETPSEATAAPAAAAWHELSIDQALAASAAADADVEPRAIRSRDPLMNDFADADLWMPLPATPGAWPQVEGPSIKASVVPDEQVSTARTRTATATAAAPPAATLKKSSSSPDEEWGTFDPTQSGFVALLEKLQEVAE